MTLFPYTTLFRSLHLILSWPAPKFLEKAQIGPKTILKLSSANPDPNSVRQLFIEIPRSPIHLGVEKWRSVTGFVRETQKLEAARPPLMETCESFKLLRSNHEPATLHFVPTMARWLWSDVARSTKLLAPVDHGQQPRFFFFFFFRVNSTAWTVPYDIYRMNSNRTYEQYRMTYTVWTVTVHMNSDRIELTVNSNLLINITNPNLVIINRLLNTIF